MQLLLVQLQVYIYIAQHCKVLSAGPLLVIVRSDHITQVRLCECACASDTVHIFNYLIPCNHQTVKRLYVCIDELQVLDY